MINQLIETLTIVPGRLLCPDWNQKPIIPVTFIQTLFDPLKVENITFPGPKGSEENLFQFTEEQSHDLVTTVH